MSPRPPQYVKPKPRNKTLEKIQINLAKKKLLDLGMELIKESEIKAFFEDYQTFMDWNHPLDFVVEPFYAKREGRNCWATVIPPQEEGKPYVLEVDITASSIRKNDYKALLFHEFTHIYDDLTIHTRIRKNGVIKPGSWYTEAHATEIELMCASGIDSYASNERVNLSCLIPYYGREITLESFALQKEQEIKLRIADNDIPGAIKHLQYYIGFVRFVMYHCEPAEYDLVKQESDQLIISTFGEEARLIRDLLLRTSISSNAFNRINNLQSILLKRLAIKQIISKTASL